MQTTDTVVCLTTVTSGNEEKGGGKDAIKVGSTTRVHAREARSGISRNCACLASRLQTVRIRYNYGGNFDQGTSRMYNITPVTGHSESNQ